MPTQTTSKLKPIEYLCHCLKTRPVVHIVADSGILEAGMYDFSVTREDYYRLLRKQPTDASIITVWQMILHSRARTGMNKCAFLNPYNILGEECQKNPEGVVSYLVDSMRLHHGKLFLVAPYLQNKHWVLLVICLRNRIVYILDSLRKLVQKPVDSHYLLKKHVDMAFMRFDKDTSTRIGWILAECNQQLGAFESGHYVMRWMYDFVMTRQHGFPSKSGSMWDDKAPFEEKMLVATVTSWSREFVNDYMKDVVV